MCCCSYHDDSSMFSFVVVSLLFVPRSSFLVLRSSFVHLPLPLPLHPVSIFSKLRSHVSNPSTSSASVAPLPSAVIPVTVGQAEEELSVFKQKNMEVRNRENETHENVMSCHMSSDGIAQHLHSVC